MPIAHTRRQVQGPSDYPSSVPSSVPTIFIEPPTCKGKAGKGGKGGKGGGKGMMDSSKSSKGKGMMMGKGSDAPSSVPTLSPFPSVSPAPSTTAVPTYGKGKGGKGMGMGMSKGRRELCDDENDETVEVSTQKDLNSSAMAPGTMLAALSLAIACWMI